MRNNLTSQLNIDTRDIGVTPDDNVVLCCGPGPFISWYVNGVAQFLSATGTYMNGNIIETQGAKGEFLNFNPAMLTYTVMLKSSAQARGAGAAGAPTIDIAGYTRTAPHCRSLFVPVLIGKSARARTLGDPKSPRVLLFLIPGLFASAGAHS